MRRGSKTADVISRTLTVAILVPMIFLATGLILLHIKGDKILSVQTASMVPTFSPGDALVIHPSKASNLKVGQIISYRNPRNPNLTITHRLIAIDSTTGWVTTSGDARQSKDASFSPQLVIGKAILLLPNLGSILNSLRTPLGLIVAIYAPTAILMIFEAHHLANAYARPIYSARL